MTATATAVATAEVAVAERHLDAPTELLESGYRLSVQTRIEVHVHKVGAHPITYADQLLVDGPGRIPDHLRAAIVENKPLFLAAACVLNPPATPSWLRRLVRRRPPTKINGSGSRELLITPGTLAANIAAFVGLDPIDDAHRIEAVVRAAVADARV